MEIEDNGLFMDLSKAKIHKEMWQMIFAYNSELENLTCRSICRESRDLIPAPDCETLILRNIKCIKMAARLGSINIMNWMIADIKIFHSMSGIRKRKIAKIAAEYGHLSMLRRLMNTETDINLRCARAAARNGQLSTLEYLYECLNPGTTWDKTVPIAAACSGQLEIIQWLYIRFFSLFNEDTFMASFRGGHLPVIIWLIDKFRERILDMEGYIRHSYFMIATEAGHLPVLQWLYENKKLFPAIRHMCSAAIINNHIHVIRWIYEIDIHENAYEQKIDHSFNLVIAAKHGHLEILQFLESF